MRSLRCFLGWHDWKEILLHYLKPEDCWGLAKCCPRCTRLRVMVEDGTEFMLPEILKQKGEGS